ncbi:MAG TPA: ABC transporter permease [Jatrophihabitans sp.]|nr:ABC transporter permease [Jatrophihabitans sp.]
MRSHLRAVDALSLGVVGVRARRVRSALSALGIAVAIAALVAVLGIAASAKADLLAQLGQQGNLLTLAAGQTFSGNPAPLPTTAEAMVRAVPPVRQVTAVANVSSATVRRSAAVPAIQTGGISVLAAQPSLPRTVSAELLRGHFLDAVANRYPEIVLGYAAAQNLGIDQLSPVTQVYVSGRYFVVVGVLAPVAVAPEIDDAAVVSFPVARSLLGLVGGPTRIYVRADPDQVAAVAAVLPFTASPQQPEAVEVRRPSDILLARIAAKTAFVGLFLALGAVALVVGGVGIANIMVISVLERRAEIGLRRAVGARGRQVGLQFFLEATALAALGGLLGLGLGCLATAVADHVAGNPVTVPSYVLGAGLGAAVAVGVLAGVYPAVRAARLAPAEALRASR